MRFKKIIATTLTAACICTSFAATVSAAAVSEETASTYSFAGGVSPLHDIAMNPKTNLSITGTTAVCFSSTESNSNTVKITIEHTLQKYTGWFWAWDDVEDATWTKTENSTSVTLVSAKTDLASGTYRVKSVFTLTDSNGEKETVTIYSNEDSVN